MNPLPIESRSDPKRASRRLSIVFIAVVLILSLLRSSQIIFVIVLYVCLLFAGISLAVFLMYSLPEWRLGNFTESENVIEAGPKGTDVVSSLNIYVKFASRGSSHSRREIAYMLKNIIANQNSSRKLIDNSIKDQFERDINWIVYPYIADNLGNTRAKNLGFTTKASREERAAYLASLERIMHVLNNQGLT